jgi:hypothetical protein
MNTANPTEYLTLKAGTNNNFASVYDNVGEYKQQFLYLYMTMLVSTELNKKATYCCLIRIPLADEDETLTE